MKTLITNIALLLIAATLFALLAPIGLLVQCYYSIWHLTLIQDVSKLMRSLAVAIDQIGNVVCATLFNLTLIERDAEDKFGHEAETISSVLGKNKLANKLTRLGKALDWILDKIDPNHSVKWITYIERYKPNAKP